MDKLAAPNLNASAATCQSQSSAVLHSEGLEQGIGHSFDTPSSQAGLSAEVGHLFINEDTALSAKEIIKQIVFATEVAQEDLRARV